MITQKMLRSKSSHYLPEELIFKILLCTRATSLFRFKSVCKLWHSIISDKRFIESQHTNSLKNPSILASYVITSEGRKVDSCNRSAASIVYSNSPKDSVDLLLPSTFDNMEIVSSCNGIVCVRNFSGDDIYLMNPSTRMSKRLPRFLNLGGQRKKVDVAFGFDCVSHDFKVLKITYVNDVDIQYKFYQTPILIVTVHLYTSNANTWRPIEIPTLLKFRRWSAPKPVLTSGPVINGVLYLEGSYDMLTFDLHDEIFGQLVQFPDNIGRGWIQNMFCDFAILDFEGHLAMIYKSGKDFSLWIMEVVSGKVFWNKTITFDASSEINWVYLYSGAKEFFGKTKSGEVILYNYQEKKTKYIQLASGHRLKRAIRHTESLLSIKGFL